MMDGYLLPWLLYLYYGWMYHVWCMVSFILLHLYYGFDNVDVYLFLHMYILLSLSYPMTFTVDD